MNTTRYVIRFWLMMALMLIPLAAAADSISDLRKQTEVSMLLTGSVEVGLDGSLRGYQLDQPEEIDPSVRDFVERNIKGWSFTVGALPKGVSGNAVILNSMSILVVAKPVERDTFQVRLAAAHFIPKNPEPETQFGYKDQIAPRYPKEAVRAGVGGTVFLAVKVAADGSVEDAIAEQVNLNVMARTEKEMTRWRTVLAASALKAARNWTFVVPTRGKRADQPFFVVRAPVEYEVGPKKRRQYAEWAPYIRGPRQANPWERADDNASFAPDALAANGGVYSNDGLHLKSPLQGTANGS